MTKFTWSAVCFGVTKVSVIEAPKRSVPRTALTVGGHGRRLLKGLDMAERNETAPPLETALRVSAAITHLEYVLQGRQSIAGASVAVTSLLHAAQQLEEIA